jgi:hypothetical protein
LKKMCFSVLIEQAVMLHQDPDVLGLFQGGHDMEDCEESPKAGLLEG